MEGIIKLVELLGEKNVERLKERIVHIIGDRIEKELDSWGDFIFYPPDYEDFFNSCFETATKKVKKRMVEKMENQILEAQVRIGSRDLNCKEQELTSPSEELAEIRKYLP